MSILGLTIDYGPYGWIDNYDPHWTPNTTDAQGRRYCFGNQPKISHWNLYQLANAIAPLFDSTKSLELGLEHYAHIFLQKEKENIAAKLGFSECKSSDIELMNSLTRLLEKSEVDMTIFFRTLSENSQNEKLDQNCFSEAYYDPEKKRKTEDEWRNWINLYLKRAAQDGMNPEVRRNLMLKTNPKYVLRNYLSQKAIELAENGDFSLVHKLLDVMRRPYEAQISYEEFAKKRPDWAREKPGCSMLSCSS